MTCTIPDIVISVTLEPNTYMPNWTISFTFHPGSFTRFYCAKKWGNHCRWHDVQCYSFKICESHRPKVSHRLETIPYQNCFWNHLYIRIVSPVIFKCRNNSLKMSFLFFIVMSVAHFVGISCTGIIHYHGTLDRPNIGGKVIKFTSRIW